MKKGLWKSAIFYLMYPDEMKNGHITKKSDQSSATLKYLVVLDLLLRNFNLRRC